MDSPNPTSNEPSGASTPNSRFTSQAITAEDTLKSQTVGLVTLADFRKRRAEALEQQELEASRAGTPVSESSAPADNDTAPKLFKKRKKAVKKGALSFGNEDEEEATSTITSKDASRAPTPLDMSQSAAPTPAGEDSDSPVMKKKLGANSNVGFTAKSMTKASLLKEAQMKEQLRKEFLVIQEAVKATDFLIPFVFYDGTNIPGGVCRMKKGDFVWLFLDRARKVGAELGIGGSDKARREWARVGVDDLMLVKGDLIIPHHYTFYHFMVNKTVGYDGPLFPHSAEPTSSTPLTPAEGSTPGGLSIPDPAAMADKSRAQTPVVADSELEGFSDDPSTIKVVDRRWYEKNKHIFPASTWEDFDPTRDYTKGGRKDAQGNAFFFGK